MSKDYEGSLGDQNIANRNSKDSGPQSIGDQQTFAGSGPRSGPQSLGDEMTLGGGGEQDRTLDEGMEIVDLSARYKIEGTLGKGGMGEVLLATDTRLDRKVAIKRILGEASRSRTAVKRFLTEAKSIAALNHPNIVQIYDYGRATDGPFLIMEYVDGFSLLDKCRGNPLPLEEAIELTCQLCDGLGKAHDAGIIHRDIKPANVLMTTDGKPKLTDFGLAKLETSDHGQTMAGAVLGTIDFMSPEQRRDAANTDARSDLWSLAATFYQMITGKSPRIIRLKDIPASLHEVVEKALEDSKEDRYQTAREFRDAIRASTQTRPAVSFVQAELGSGECLLCHKLNEPHRNFCRECGASLKVKCSKCNETIPIWEKICGHCGENASRWVNEQLETYRSRSENAEILLENQRFLEADAIARELSKVDDVRMNAIHHWATNFLVKLQRTKEDALTRAEQSLKTAQSQLAECRYEAVIKTLESIPAHVRNQQANECMETARQKQRQAEYLLQIINQSLRQNELQNTYDRLQELKQILGDDQRVTDIEKAADVKVNEVIARLCPDSEKALDRREFKEAIGIADAYSWLNKTKFAAFFRWRESLLERVASKRNKASEHAVESLRQAAKLKGEFKYLEALVCIDSIHEECVTDQTNCLRESVEEVFEIAEQVLFEAEKSLQNYRYDEVLDWVDCGFDVSGRTPRLIDLETQAVLAMTNQLKQRQESVKKAIEKTDLETARQIASEFLNLDTKRFPNLKRWYAEFTEQLKDAETATTIAVQNQVLARAKESALLGDVSTAEVVVSCLLPLDLHEETRQVADQLWRQICNAKQIASQIVKVLDQTYGPTDQVVENADTMLQELESPELENWARRAAVAELIAISIDRTNQEKHAFAALADRVEPRLNELANRVNSRDQATGRHSFELGKLLHWLSCDPCGRKIYRNRLDILSRRLLNLVPFSTDHDFRFKAMPAPSWIGTGVSRKPLLWMETPVTQKVYSRVLGMKPPSARNQNRPAVERSMTEIQRFINCLNQEDNSIAEGRHYRLPTTEEWRQVCKTNLLIMHLHELHPQPMVHCKETCQQHSRLFSNKTILPEVTGPDIYAAPILKDLLGTVAEVTTTGDTFSRSLIVCGGDFLCSAEHCHADSAQKWNGKAQPNVGFRLVCEIKDEPLRRIKLAQEWYIQCEADEFSTKQSYLKRIDRLLRLWPEHSEMLYVRWEFMRSGLTSGSDDLEEAIGEFVETCEARYPSRPELNPGFERVVGTWASGLHRLGKSWQAFDLLRSHAENFPQGFQASLIVYNLACYCREEEEAIAYLQRAAELGYSNVELFETDPDLEKLRSAKYRSRLETVEQSVVANNDLPEHVRQSRIWRCFLGDGNLETGDYRFRRMLSSTIQDLRANGKRSIFSWMAELMGGWMDLERVKNSHIVEQKIDLLLTEFPWLRVEIERLHGNRFTCLLRGIQNGSDIFIAEIVCTFSGRTKNEEVSVESIDSDKLAQMMILQVNESSRDVSPADLGKRPVSYSDKPRSLYFSDSHASLQHSFTTLAEGSIKQARRSWTEGDVKKAWLLLNSYRQFVESLPQNWMSRASSAKYHFTELMQIQANVDSVIKLEDSIEERWNRATADGLDNQELYDLSNAISVYLSQNPKHLESQAIFEKLIAQLAKNPDSADAYHDVPVWLSRLREVWPKLSEVLAKLDCHLNLSMVESLSLDTARHLSDFKQSINLDGLATIDVDIAETLVGTTALRKTISHDQKDSARSISLSGVTSLTSEVASALALHQGPLILDGVTHLSRTTAHTFRVHNGSLSLRGLKELSHEIADAIAVNKGDLHLDGLESISEHIDWEALKKEGIFVDPTEKYWKIKHVSEALQKHRGRLTLNGLKGLILEDARCLRDHDGPIELRNVTNLSTNTLATLAESPHTILIGPL